MATIPVLTLDPDLGAAVAEPQRSLAARSCRASELEVARGEWEADALEPDPGALGLLVISGILCRRVSQSERYGAELVGPGDLLRPWDKVGGWTTIPAEASWTAIEPTRLALLDGDFARRAARFPEIAAALLRRSVLRSRYLALLVAIISQRRVETRLNMLFWHLADRFGQVHGEGVEIPVPLTHSLLAELVAARRPSVTTALSRLQEQNVLRRKPGGWQLTGTAPPEYAALVSDL
jgi:CRP/FNR family transcriptional regulator, cyclic AMP receptor protein